MPSPSILLLAGEASGDHHAAAMVREIKSARPDVEVSGIGGDRLAAAGMRLLHHYREINTIGVSEGLRQIRNIFAAYRTMKAELQSGRHSLFIPVDFPDVNLRLCGIARSQGIPVYYYISPQVWAWRKGRIRKIAARVNRMMTIFPFEETLYRGHGVPADFVGHTMVRDIPAEIDRSAVRRDLGVADTDSLVAILPGSRPAEIRRMLPVMCDAARLHQEAFPETRFALPLAGEHLAGLVTEIIEQHRVAIGVHLYDAARLMAACDSGLVTSGTATLQAALAGMPHAVVYRLDALSWWFAVHVLKPLVMAKDVHVAIANVIAISMHEFGKGPIVEMLEAGYRIPCLECGRPLFVPELLQHHATPEVLAEWLFRFRTDASLRAAIQRGFAQIRQSLTPTDETRTPAAVVLAHFAQ